MNYSRLFFTTMVFLNGITTGLGIATHSLGYVLYGLAVGTVVGAFVMGDD